MLYTDGTPHGSWTGQKRCRLAGGPVWFLYESSLVAPGPLGELPRRSWLEGRTGGPLGGPIAGGTGKVWEVNATF